MASAQGFNAIGTYTGSTAAKLAVLLGLIPNPDAEPGTGAVAGGGFGQANTYLDEMSPGAATQLRVEIAALAAAAGSGGSYTVTAADVTATQANIVTGLADIDLTKSAVMIRRAGSIVTGDAVISEPSAGTIRVVSGASTYTLTAGDVIIYQASLT